MVNLKYKFTLALCGGGGWWLKSSSMRSSAEARGSSGADDDARARTGACDGGGRLRAPTLRTRGQVSGTAKREN